MFPVLIVIQGDEGRPECLNCQQRGDQCEWGMKITFRATNATQIDSGHPSMQEGSRKRARRFKVYLKCRQPFKNNQADLREDSRCYIASRE